MPDSEMKREGKKTILLTLMLISTMLLPLGALTTSSALVPSPGVAPFSIDIQPTKTTAKVGDSVTYKLKITAETGFTGSVKLELTITAMGYSATLDLGTHNPPYPKEFEHTVKLPESIPVDVTAKGTLKATSGSYVEQKEVEITIVKSDSGGGGFLDWLIHTLQEIWKRILSIFGL